MSREGERSSENLVATPLGSSESQNAESRAASQSSAAKGAASAGQQPRAAGPPFPVSRPAPALWLAEVTGWNVEGESVEGSGRGDTEDAAIEDAYRDARWIVETGDVRTWERR